MDDLVVAGLCLLCWINGVWFGWLLWRLPKLAETRRQRQGDSMKDHFEVRQTADGATSAVFSYERHSQAQEQAAHQRAMAYKAQHGGHIVQIVDGLEVCNSLVDWRKS